MLMVLLAAVLAASPAHAQLSRLDKATLIEGLRQEGMRDLLRHLAKSELGDDPVLQKQVIINQHLLDYEEHLDAGKLDQAASAFDLAAEVSVKLIDENKDHEQRPIWQTQLAEQLLFETLSTLHRNADLFYEFGVPTARQAAVFEQVAPEALAMLEDADVRFFKLQSDLPKDPDHTEKRIDTGLWDRMINQFYNVRTQFLFAHALYYTWRLPDDHPYFQNLGGNPRIVRQAKSIDKERQRLLSLAAERLDNLLGSPKAKDWGIEEACRCLLGRVRAAQHNGPEATTLQVKVITAKRADLLGLTAHLAHGFELARQGRLDEAEANLTALSSHPIVTGNLLLRLLVVDAVYRVRREAARDAATIAASYRPYLDFIDDPSLGESRQGMRDYIHRRWVSSVGESANLSQLPPVVVAAMGRMLRVEGQNLAVETTELTDAAKQKLQRAEQINSQLLKRSGIDDTVRAEAMYNHAVAVYFLGRDDVGQILRSANMMVDLAEKYPKESVSEEAIGSAVAGVLHTLHVKAKQIAGVEESYRRGAALLISKFADSDAAADERYYYAARVLMPARRFPEAATVLGAVPFGHPSYFEAQRELLYCRLALLKEGAGDAARLSEQAKRLQTEADVATGESRAAAINAGGHAVIVQSELAALNDNIDRAVKLLDDFEGRYGTDAELIREALGRRIAWMAASDRFEDAAREAQKMMDSFPDDAVPVIDSVLADLDQQVGKLRNEANEEIVERKREKLEKRITSIANTARTLAKLLVDWASGQGLAADDMVPYRLLLARSSRLAGAPAEGLAQLRPLMKQYAEDADVIFETAETLFAVADETSMIEAVNLYTGLIEGLPTNDDGSHPPRYFAAWMRYFQICEKLKQNTDDIPLTVRQLELTDPNLGGEPYRTELIRLRHRFTR